MIFPVYSCELYIFSASGAAPLNLNRPIVMKFAKQTHPRNNAAVGIRLKDRGWPLLSLAVDTVMSAKASYSQATRLDFVCLPAGAAVIRYDEKRC